MHFDLVSLTETTLFPSTSQTGNPLHSFIYGLIFAFNQCDLHRTLNLEEVFLHRSVPIGDGFYASLFVPNCLVL